MYRMGIPRSSRDVSWMGHLIGSSVMAADYHKSREIPNMATCLDIVTYAMRELGVLSIGREPRAAEADEGMVRLQAIIDSMWGAGIGAPLLDQELDANFELIADTRALVYAASAITLTFPERPFNGARIQVKDMLGTFATDNVTLDGNNRYIELSLTKTLSTNGTDTTWVYEAETANWAKVSPLALADTLPFTDNEFFTLALAKRLAPVFGAQFASEDALLRSANRIRAKFASEVIIPADDAVRFLSRQSYGCGFTGR